MNNPIKPASENLRPLKPTRKIAQENGVTPRTIDRWVRRGILAKPDQVINGRKYWREGNDRPHSK